LTRHRRDIARRQLFFNSFASNLVQLIKRNQGTVMLFESDPSYAKNPGQHLSMIQTNAKIIEAKSF